MAFNQDGLKIKTATVAALLIFAQTALSEPIEDDSFGPVDPELAAAIEQDGIEAPVRPPPSVSDVFRRSVPESKARFIPDISFIVDVGMGWFFGGRPVTQGGHAMDRNGFTLQGLEMAVSGVVDPYFRYDMNFEFGHLHLEEAYITTLSLPINMQIRAGYMNVPFGRQNPRHLHAWNFVNPPLSHTRFMGEEHFSGLGAELSFLIPVPWAMTVGAQILDSHDETALRSATFGTVNLTGKGELDGFEDFVYTARIENSFDLARDWTLVWGLSGAWGQSPWVPDNRSDLYGTDLYVKWRPISSGKGAMTVALTVEYILRRTQIPSDLLIDHGGYAQIDVGLTRRWMLGFRGDMTGIISGTSPDSEKISGRQWRAGASVSFMPTHFSRLRLQYDIGRQTAEDIYHALFVQIEIGVGEHMAHKF